MDITTICNLALARLGAGRIMSLDDPTQEARACNTIFNHTRDEVLRAHNWNFAKRLAVLSMLQERPLFDFSYAFSLPVDCLRVRQVNGFDAYEPRYPWEVVGRKLLTDSEEANITYTTNAAQAGEFDTIFVEALSIKLAAKLAMALNGSTTLTANLTQEYESIISGRARRADASEQRAKRKPAWVESDFVRARHGGIH